MKNKDNLWLCLYKLDLKMDYADEM